MNMMNNNEYIQYIFVPHPFLVLYLWIIFIRKLLFQNLLFYYDTEQSAKPTGVIFLEVTKYVP